MTIRQTRSLLIAGSTVWCAAILAAPLFDLTGLYEWFRLTCHQLPDRSWSLNGQPLPVCVRCASLAFGFLTATVLAARADTVRLRMAIGLTVVQIVLAVAWVDSEVLRASSGILLSWAVQPFVLEGLHEVTSPKS